MWLDKLGISAALGISVVVRQDFYGGHYSLIDSKTLDPNPDFWLSYIFNTLVGQSVFNVSVQDKSGYVRMYSHCTNDKRSNYTHRHIEYTLSYQCIKHVRQPKIKIWI
jgi:heparanase 1